MSSPLLVIYGLGLDVSLSLEYSLLDVRSANIENIRCNPL